MITFKRFQDRSTKNMSNDIFRYPLDGIWKPIQKMRSVNKNKSDVNITREIYK